MKYNSVPGIIYDSIYYSLICFNKENVKKLMKTYAEKESDIFINYDEFSKCKNVTPPPEELYPFFYYGIKRPCLMSEFFIKQFDFFEGTFESFIKQINDKRYFKRFVYFYHLEDYKENIDIESVIKGDSESISKALVALRWHGEKVNLFIKLFYHFDDLVDELIEHLNKIVLLIKKYHSKKKNVFPNVADEFCQKKNINYFIKVFNNDRFIDINNQLYSVCFLNSYVVMYRYKNSTEFCFVLGCDSKLIPSNCRVNNNIDYIGASRIFAQPIMNDLINELKKGESTITKLSKTLHISRTTIDRFITVLYDEAVIKISKRDGKEIYYNLNLKYFLIAKSVYNENIDKILECYEECFEERSYNYEFKK